jgi:hypothetical protein
MSTTAVCILMWIAGPFATAAQPAPRSAVAIIDVFAGTWKEDLSKRKIGSEADLHFQTDANGELQELRGPETRPIVQTIVFDGKAHDTGHGNRIAWTRTNDRSFERILSDSQTGRTVTTRRIRMSADGNTLTEATTRTTTDGRPSTETVIYRRLSGGPHGLPGRWRATSFETTLPPILKYQRSGTAGLTFSDTDSGATYTFLLDDTPVPVVGSGVIAGLMVSAKAVDDHTISFTERRDGAIIQRVVRTVSPTGTTLTVTATPVVPNAAPESSITVYVKQK